ncbi:MAG: hypothetical protein WD080_08165 [Egibacteraceae bacterium]
MSLLLDANLAVYAAMPAMDEHEIAVAWLRARYEDTTELVATPGLTSNDVPDVQLAALAIEHGLTLCTHDHGFARFARLSWTDPLG